MKKLIATLLVLTLCMTMGAAMADTMGLGMVTSISSTSATTEKDGTIQISTTACAVTLDADGKIVSIQFDVMQSPKVGVTAAGEIADTAEADLRTKVEKGDDYAMRAASPIGKELNEQVEVLQSYCIGKTAEEAAAGFEADADAKAGCTIHVDDFFAALTKAAANAK